MKSINRLMGGSIALILVSQFVGVARADVQTWQNGGDTLFATPGNWDVAAAPVNGDSLVFGSASFGTTLTRNETLTSIAGITFNADALNYIINGTAAMTYAGTITVNGGSQILAMSSTASGAQTHTLASGTTLTFGGTGSNFAHLLQANSATVLSGSSATVNYYSSSSGSMSIGGSLVSGNTGSLNAGGLGALNIKVGTFNVGADGSTATGNLTAATTTTIYANTIVMGKKRTSGTITATGGKTITIRGYGGTMSDKANATFGDYNTSNSAQTPTGNLNALDSTVDATMGTLILGTVSTGGVPGNGGTINARGYWKMGDGTVTADTVRLGYYNGGSVSAGSTGTATGALTMAGGTFTVSTALNIGDQATSQANSYTSGTVSISGGTLDVSGAFVIGKSAGTATAANQAGILTITGGTVDARVNITTLNSKSTLTLNGGTLDMHGNAIGTAAQQIGSNGGALSFFSGTLKNVSDINGGAGLTKTSSGSLTVENLTYAGNTVISLGNLRAGADNALPYGSGKGDVVINGGATAGALDLYDHDVAINGLAGTTGTVLGTVANNNGSATKTLTLGNNDATADFAGSIVDNTGTGGKVAITKTGAGTQTFSGANTYTGGTQINNGILAVSGGFALADDGAVALADVSGATLRLDNSETIGSLAGGGATGGNVNLQANALTVGDANDTSYGGAMVGNGGSLIKQGAGKLTITGNGHTFDGGTEIQNGTLELSGGGLTDTGALNVNGSGAKFDLGGGSDTVGAVTLTDGQINNGTLTGSGYTVKKGSVSAVLAGAGSALIKETAGTVTLSNVNTYGGGTTVNNGTLAVSGSVSGGATVAGGTLNVTGTGTLNGGATVNGGKLVADGTVNGTVTVNSGGTLGGSGTMADATTIATGGVLSPGNSPGQLTHEDGLTLSNGSTYVWELVVNDAGVAGTDFDQELITGGNLVVDAGATLSLVFNSAGSSVDWSNLFWADPHQWVIMDFSGTGTSSGNFGTVTVSLDSGDQNLADVRPEYMFSSVRSGNNLVLNYDVIPEPATAGVLLMGLMGLALRRRALNAD